jgi:hypothetical protein
MLIQIRDLLHQRRIDEARRALLSARTPAERRQHAAEMRDLIQQRSPAEVARMERQRGIG